MKKSALALAIAAALTASAVVQADTTLYGSARISVDYVDADDLNGGEDFFDLFNNSSRLGVRGSEDLGNGLSAIYQYEFGIDPTGGNQAGGTYFNSNRPRWAGLKGGFGAITMGTQFHPYYNVIGIGDIFNSSRTFSTEFGGFLAPRTRFGKTFLYVTPDFGGFTVEAALILDGSNNEPQGREDAIDAWNLAAKYKNGPLFAGITYFKQEGDSSPTDSRGRPISPNPSSGGGIPNSTDLIGAAIGYEFGAVSLTASYELADTSVEGGFEAENFLVTASYKFGNNTVRGYFSYLNPDDFEESLGWGVGFQHSLSKRTRLWVEYLGRSNEDPAQDPDGLYGDATVFSIGMRHDF